MNNHMKPRL